MKFDIKKHIYLILLFILSFTVETAQSQEVTNIHIAATDTVPTYTSDSAVINFLKDAGIPIAVDTATDAKIRTAFSKEIPNTTKIIIAQRISSVQDADKIIVLDDGKISGIGTHEELLENNEIYADVYNSQVKGDDEEYEIKK